MSDLHALIRTAARTGRLNHLSVAFMNGKWSASYRGVSDSDKSIVEHSDPVLALVWALSGRKPAEPVAEKPKKVMVVKPSEDEDLL